MSRATAKSLLPILLIALSAPVWSAFNQPVRIDTGLVSGVTNGKVTAFKGIPYAAPPIGDLRWREPRPAASWQGVRPADRFSAGCVQRKSGAFGPWSAEFIAKNAMEGGSSEDCLYLNVWTAAAKSGEKRPVIVWIHGDGFNSGSGDVPVYDGEGLASKGVVMVTINYRLGVFGFLAYPGLHPSGNYALLDMIAALHWVRKNIAAFGGDPANVTIAGQSAGAFAVNYLMASPLAKGLFQRAIVESGGSNVDKAGLALVARSLADAEKDGVKFADAKGAASLKELRALSWQKLMEPVSRGPRFAPIVDGYSLPAQVREIVRQGKQNDVVTLTGANTGELGGLTPTPGPVTAEMFRNRARMRFGDAADEFLKLYPAATDEEARIAQEQSVRDQALVSMFLWSRERAKTAKTKVYEYLWDHALPGPDAARYGAFHTSELPYAMNTLYMSDRPFTDADRKTADTMSSYWANFAANGDPNGKGLPHWPAVGEKPEVMEVGDKTAPVPAAGSAAKFRFFEEFLSK